MPPLVGSTASTVDLPIWSKISDLFAFGIQNNSLGQLVTRAVEVLLIIAILLSLLYLVVGAVNWITSEGKPDKLEHARNNVIHAIVGLVLAIAAYVIWLLVVKDFFGIDIQKGINIGGPGTTTTIPGGGTGGGTGGTGSCGSTPIGSRANDGGAGGYCNGGAAEVECHGPDTHGSTTYSYPHFDPCQCITGTENTSYDFTSC